MIRWVWYLEAGAGPRTPLLPHLMHLVFPSLWVVFSLFQEEFLAETVSNLCFHILPSKVDDWLNSNVTHHFQWHWCTNVILNWMRNANHHIIWKKCMHLVCSSLYHMLIPYSNGRIKVLQYSPEHKAPALYSNSCGCGGDRYSNRALCLRQGFQIESRLGYLVRLKAKMAC